MCLSVDYGYQSESFRVCFTHPKATLPIRTRTGEDTFLPWGRRKLQKGVLPLGCCAQLGSIYAGRWDKWFPVPVKIRVQRFMERDMEGHTHWFDLPKGKWIQGLVARERYERRVYVVTVEPQCADSMYERWPRVFC
ncbi:hypothetical protein MNBD_GAMMA15-2610 [hydrothermal vent metagenome]|uniref:Uncharacterized protein n=1 Tax=hydrothermal vent metagenome TaxID=652676 RepID=A0A3B0YZE2_9ZZZZ